MIHRPKPPTPDNPLGIRMVSYGRETFGKPIGATISVQFPVEFCDWLADIPRSRHGFAIALLVAYGLVHRLYIRASDPITRALMRCALGSLDRALGRVTDRPPTFLEDLEEILPW